MPKMSFGTAHHETTKLMIRYIDRMELKGKSLLDMGSGTGVLAILARKKGADPVTAIDNDTWAFENAKENIVLNDVPDIEVLQGDSGLLSNRKFDIILANINRNILLNDMEAYNSSLNADGKLIMSGFYLGDLQIITEKATEMGMKLD
jgi:ribosomal protein L11 methyltransferase